MNKGEIGFNKHREFIEKKHDKWEKHRRKYNNTLNTLKGQQDDFLKSVHSNHEIVTHSFISKHNLRKYAIKKKLFRIRCKFPIGCIIRFDYQGKRIVRFVTDICLSKDKNIKGQINIQGKESHENYCDFINNYDICYIWEFFMMFSYFMNSSTILGKLRFTRS